jgi:EpsI family protein
MSGVRYYVAIGLLAAAAALLGLKGALDPLGEHRVTPIAIPLKEFPHEIGGWKGEDRPLTDFEDVLIQPDDYVRRTYRRGNELVNLFICYHGNKLEGLKRVHHNPTICMPRAGWKHEDEAAWASQNRVETFNDIAKRVPFSSHYFTKRGGADFYVMLFFSVDGVLETVHRDSQKEPLRRLIDRMTEVWKGPGYVIQVQVGTSPGGDPKKGYDRILRFLRTKNEDGRSTMYFILRHFQEARVEHE